MNLTPEQIKSLRPGGNPEEWCELNEQMMVLCDMATELLAEKKLQDKQEKIINELSGLLHTSTLHGYHVPSGKVLFDRRTNPQVGDFVCEASMGRLWREGTGKCFGFLMEIMKGEFETRYLIKHLNGGMTEWENCSFHVLFESGSDELQRIQGFR